MLDAIRRDLPVFGICFGAELIAHALGGSVRRSEIPEVGWYTIESDVPEIATGPWMEWHSDVFTVPPGAVELARSPIGPQAFTIGRTLAVQFHPEAGERILRSWSDAGGEAELVGLGIDPESLFAAAARASADSEPACHQLVDWFLSQMGVRSGAERPLLAGSETAAVVRRNHRESQGFTPD